MTVTVTYFPPSTVAGISSVTFDNSGKFMLMGMQGLSSLPAQPMTAHGPFQPGDTLLDNRVTGKRFAIMALVYGDSRSDYWAQRNTLAHALSVVPRFDLRTAEAGLLRLSREGHDDIDIECVPTGAPSFEEGGPLFARAQIEFFAPSPWWTSTTDMIEIFTAKGGIEIPHSSESPAGLDIPHSSEPEAGLAIELDQQTSSINNDGHVPTPFEVEIGGEVTDPLLELVETGETLGLTGTISSGETVTISTHFGRKRITLTDASGNESNAFDMLDADHADFFWLIRGSNTLRGTFGTNVSGSMKATWRKRYSGA